MSIELPPLPGTALIFPNGKPERVMDADMVERAVEARERILQASIAEAEEQRGQWAGLCTRLEARIAELEDEVHAHTEALKVFEAANAELEADAERYRWLRARLIIEDIHNCLPYNDCGQQADVDAAIDAAREAK